MEPVDLIHTRPGAIASCSERGAKRMPVSDLRDWIDRIDAQGQLRRVDGADCDEGIGGLTDLYMEKVGRPALLFDNIPGYPPGFRVALQRDHIARTSGRHPGHAAGPVASGHGGALPPFPWRPARHRAAGGGRRTAAGERGDGERRRHAPVPHPEVARRRRRPLPRNGLCGHHAGPGLRLGQRWVLPGRRPRPGHLGNHDHGGQAGASHHGEVLAPERSLPGGRILRPRPVDLPDGRTPRGLRRLRIRRGRRNTRRARGRRPGRGHGPAPSGDGRDRRGRVHPRGAVSNPKDRSESGPAITRVAGRSSRSSRWRR